MKIWVEPAGVSDSTHGETEKNIHGLELYRQISSPPNVFSAVVSIPRKDRVISQSEEYKGFRKLEKQTGMQEIKL